LENSDNENIYARWINGTLTAGENQNLEKSGEASVLRKIVSETDTWTLPEPAGNSYLNIKSRIQKPGNEKELIIIPIYRKRWFLSAAAVLVAVSVFSVWMLLRPENVTYASKGENLKVFLPDSTEVVLAGFSSLSYDKQEWEDKRKIKLNGEAYIQVKKKGEFEVSFKQGRVNVLGTRFTVLSGNNSASVRCFEGRVLFSAVDNRSMILEKGEGILSDKNPVLQRIFFNMDQPEWLTGESVFHDAPLIEVISALEIRFGITVESGNIDLYRRFTGKFTHSGLDSALKMVFVPMGIQYSAEGNKVVLR
jgi:transmembrane sensor